MERIDHSQIATALLASVGWARAGLMDPDERLREQAAMELAATIIETIDPRPLSDPRQLSLNL